MFVGSCLIYNLIRPRHYQVATSCCKWVRWLPENLRHLAVTNYHSNQTPYFAFAWNWKSIDTFASFSSQLGGKTQNVLSLLAVLYLKIFEGWTTFRFSRMGRWFCHSFPSEGAFSPTVTTESQSSRRDRHQHEAKAQNRILVFSRTKLQKTETPKIAQLPRCNGFHYR